MTRLEAHRDYTFGVVRLMMRHVYDLAHRNAEPVSPVTALDTHVDIMRKTKLFDGRHPALGLDPPVTAWDELKAELAARIDSHSDDDTEELEVSCWQLLLPYLAPWLDQVPNVTYPFGCWNYDIPGSKPTYLNLHFLNAFQPDSPFTERRDEFISSLLGMLKDGGKEHPQATHVCCSTWLNRFGPFNALFPTCWAESFVLTQYYATYG